ncbi:MAG: hypothetical protein C4576_15475 [Desulfobacteraceae bacterium]|nr:MAG: hypothetical protein C4576_15475 [Desulfobacteraceae bacterium]
MKLKITRNQKAQKGVFGGHKGMTFTLSSRVELTPEEENLVTKYKLENHPLTFTNQNGSQIPKETVSTLMQGTTTEVKDITILLNNEEVIKGACKDFKLLLDVMATFGGEEVIEF